MKVFFAIWPRQGFAGMEFLYNQHVKEASDRLAIVSAGPKMIRWRIMEFFDDKIFPTFSLTLKSRGLSKVDYKFNAVSDLVRRHPEHEIVLVGDDAEMDQVAYDLVRTAFPERNIRIYIRRVHSKQGRVKVDAGQIPFFSAAEIALAESVLSPNAGVDTVGIIQNTIETFKKSPKKVLPGYVACPFSAEKVLIEKLVAQAKPDIARSYLGWNSLLSLHCARRADSKKQIQ